MTSSGLLTPHFARLATYCLKKKLSKAVDMLTSLPWSCNMLRSKKVGTCIMGPFMCPPEQIFAGNYEKIPGNEEY